MKYLRRTRLAVRVSISLAVTIATCLFLIYPAVFILHSINDPMLRKTGQPANIFAWFNRTARQYGRWANRYMATRHAENIDLHDVAATEWPMFGSVFFLLAAEELAKQNGGEQLMQNPTVSHAVQKAAQVVADPATATWVINKWGKDQYLKRENAFYRMLLIMGLTSYRSLTGDLQYNELITDQHRALAREIRDAPHHLLNDYPHECYPNDVLWTVAAIQRAAHDEGMDYDTLVDDFMTMLDTSLLSPEGLPAFLADAETGNILQHSRGCGNSGILIFATELNAEMAFKWYAAYEENFWQEKFGLLGFRELPKTDDSFFADVDSGPVLFGVGSVASAIGIGAARSQGRYDHAVPLSMEAIACSWPTPFGYLIPGLMGWVAADSWCLGETAMLFVMTRPNNTNIEIPYDGPVPMVVWLLVGLFLALALLRFLLEYRYWKKWFRKRQKIMP